MRGSASSLSASVYMQVLIGQKAATNQKKSLSRRYLATSGQSHDVKNTPINLKTGFGPILRVVMLKERDEGVEAHQRPR